MDSKRVVDALLEVDPGFERLCKTLFGDLVEPADVWDFMYEQDGLSRYVAPVTKAMPDQADVAIQSGRLVRTLRRAVPPAAEGAHVKKSDTADVVWEGTFSKTDDEKRQAFGWASVVQVDGKPVIDRQGDWITPDEIEKAAYNYVLNNRKGGNQHKRTDDDQPLHASDLIESFVVTPEKIEKMGLPSDTPCGWWVGYKFHDDTAWDEVKKGVRTGFSIHGKGKRRDIDDE